MGMFKGSYKKAAAAGLAALVLTGLMAGCGMSSGGDKKAGGAAGQKVELKLAYQLPSDHHLSKSIEKFAKEVNERSKGSIDVKVYPAGQLYNDQNMNDALMSGGLDIGMNSTARWSMVVPAMKVLDLPFVLTSYQAVDNALDGDLGKALSEQLEKKGVRPLIWADYGYVQFTDNVRPLEKPEDFQGLKMRSYSEISADVLKALGASPTTMSSSEVYMGIKNGTIDGQSSGQTAILSRKIYEVSKYMTVANSSYVEYLVAINANSWKKLSPDQQKIITDVSKEIQNEIREETAGQLYNDQNMNDALMSGGLDIGMNSTARWSMVVPAMKVLDLPFVLTSYQAVDNALDGDLGKALSEQLEKKGVRPLIWADYGYVQFTDNVRPLEKPEDFQGLKMRSYSEISADVLKALGASPTTMSSSEVYMGIKNGTIDGQSSGQTAILSRKIYEVSKYMTVANSSYVEYLVAINANSWKKLSPDQQKIITDVSKEIQNEIREETKAEDQECIKELEEKGMQVYVVPQDQIHLWQEATAPVVAAFEQEQGAEGKQLVEDCLKASQAAQK